MHFFLHGPIAPDAQAALVRHGHVCHTPLELSADTPAPDLALDTPETLLPLLKKHQWNLVTVDGSFIAALYEAKHPFPATIIYILDDPADLHDQGAAIDRLFERYKRLAPWRMYTVTPNRVKVRQLPGAARA